MQIDIHITPDKVSDIKHAWNVLSDVKLNSDVSALRDWKAGNEDTTEALDSRVPESCWAILFSIRDHPPQERSVS